MSRLLSAQTTKHDGKRDFCLRCLNGFASAESLAKHKEHCKKHPVARRDLPKPENATLQFNHLNYSMSVPIIVYADFEAFTKTVHTCQPNPEHSYTKQYQKHIPSSFSYYIKCLRCLNGFASAESLAKHKEYGRRHPVSRRVIFRNRKMRHYNLST